MKKRVIAFLVCFLCFVGFLAVYLMVCNNDGQKIRDGVLRFHIVANSNSEYDQNNKYAVRDGIAQLCSTLFKNSKSKAQSIEIANANASQISQKAKQILKQNGDDCDVSVCVTKRYFPTRTYTGVTLPAGVYDTIDVRIGKAEGQNFWCVMFPDICVGASTKKTNQKKLSAVLDSDSFELVKVKKTPSVKLKFKTIEIIENVKKTLKKR